MGDVVRVAAGERVELDAGTARTLDERRAAIEDRVRRTRAPAYGFNRGFGHNVDVAVGPEELEQLQLNLIRSHSSGLGPSAPTEVVRAAMLLRAASLAKGNSGVRATVVTKLLELLNAQLTPVVPVYGSVGASGDLAPLSHIALALIGEGAVLASGSAEPVPAAVALTAAGIEPLRPQMKEGLALNNGLQFSTAYGVLALDRMWVLLETAALATAISAQVQLGSDAPYAADLHELRPHPGGVAVARWLRMLMRESPIRHAHERHAVDWQVQDPYSLRCAAQVLGACHELLTDAQATLETEINSVTDNPLLLPDEDGDYTRVVSGGHFHGMPVAVRLHGVLQAMAIAAHLSSARCARYVDERRNKGLGPDLIWPELGPAAMAASSGMMIPEYVAVALTNGITAACAPSHLMSVATDAGQEDHVSMSAGLAVRVWDTLPRLAEVLAIELAFGSQAAALRAEAEHIPTKRELTAEQREATRPEREAYEAALRRELGAPDLDVDVTVAGQHRWSVDERRLSPPCERAIAAVRDYCPVVKEDRVLSGDLAELARAVGDGEIIAAATPGMDWSE
ncbi:MAG: histidine ammonia-lyase [Anaerolineae bacterium]